VYRSDSSPVPQTLPPPERRCRVQLGLGGIENAVISGFDQNLGLDPDFVFEVAAQIAADVPVDLLLDRVAPFVERLLVLIMRS